MEGYNLVSGKGQGVDGYLAVDYPFYGLQVK